MSVAFQHPQPASTPAPAAFPGPAVAAPVVTAPAIAKPRPEYHFPVGQTLVYSGVWRIFPAGTATLSIEPAGAEHRVVGTASDSSAAAVLFRVQDHYESYFDPNTFCSHSISRSVEEGFRRVQTNITFDYARGKSVLEQKNLKKKEVKHEEHNIPGCVTDVLNGIFYLSSLPLAPGRVYSFPVNDGGETIFVNAHAEAREQVKTPAGVFNAIRVRPEAASAILKNKGNIWIWYSDDAARIPVQARVHLYWGTLTFTLLRVDKK
ncbi:MAG TPA: DUF3108 domain-containing protein [Candidatus Angelobacter sp.]|nr:DUF3108 domain-containing protein [Candidatus Angelobacter sp.]